MVNSKTAPLFSKLIAFVVIGVGSLVILHWLYCTVYGREVLLQCAPLQEPDRTDCNVCKGSTVLAVTTLTGLLSTLLALKVPVKEELRELMADREADREWDRLLEERGSRESEREEGVERTLPSIEGDGRVESDRMLEEWELDTYPQPEFTE